MAVLTQYGDHYGYAGERIPDPDARVVYPNGEFGPMMFHYLTEGCNLKQVAAENGFDIKFVVMNDELPDDDPLVIEYEGGSSDVVRKWVPPPGSDGWELAAKHDTEDGPVAAYLRKRA